MIFSKADHIEQIIEGTKTQTRRIAGPLGANYQVGKTYAVQPGRGRRGISEGRILITKRWKEKRYELVNERDAQAEGGYIPMEYEDLFESMYPRWKARWCYEFKFIPTEEAEE